MLIGYARVSTTDQNLDRQIAALRAAGVETIYREKASGKTGSKRPQLEKAIDALGTGYTLVIAEWDRATRSMDDGLKIISRIAEREATVKVLDREYLDLTSKLGKGILALLSALAEDERDRIIRRAAEGRQIAKARGKTFGRPSKLTEHQQAKARQRKATGEPLSEIAADFGVHKSTISRL